MTFNELNIKKEIKDAIVKKGFEEMTDIQSNAIPPALEGKDILGQAQTGTGKTAAFLIPVLNQITLEQKSVQCLILVPTRELALQVRKEIQLFGQFLGVKSTTIYGGDSIERQLRELKQNPHIVVATPGRCIDLIERKKLKLNNVRFFCLDEVDEMLNMGFIEDIEFISSIIPSKRQTLLFSATLPERIKKIANKYAHDLQIIKVKSKSIVADKVEQSYIIAKQKQKILILKNLIDLNKNNKIIIFTQTKRSADEVFEFLSHQGMKIGKIHGDLPQKNRTTTIQKFRENKFDLLVATDVVARGIDIDNINLVVNYELPQDMEYYIHRIGRTARGNSEKGRAITLVTPNAYNKEFKYYSKNLKIDIKEEKKPELKDVINILKEKYIKQILKNNKQVEKIYDDLANELMEQKDAKEIIVHLLEKNYPQLSEKKTLQLLEASSEKENNRRKEGRKNNNAKKNNKFQRNNKYRSKNKKRK